MKEITVDGIVYIEKEVSEKKARVFNYHENADVIRVIELTDPVRLRLSDTAGVNRKDVYTVARYTLIEERVNGFMQLIKDATPEAEDL